MKQDRNKWRKIAGWILFLIGIGFFCLQMGYMLIQPRYEVEYIDNRIFYIVNMLSVIFLFIGLTFLLVWKKWWLVSISGVVILFIIANGLLLHKSNQEIKNFTSLSPDLKQVFSVKQNTVTGEAMYYRSYYGILGRPNKRVQSEVGSDYKIEWLADDIAAFTYQAKDNTIQQFIGTYGSRGNGISYNYVSAQIHGKWQGDNARIETKQKGIAITVDGQTDLFTQDNIEQFGTLAIVLKKDNQAVWTIGLQENFEINSDAAAPTVGNISLYKATMEENEPMILGYEGE